MTRADFSTRIDVQPPNPALLSVIGDAVSNRFAGGVSQYRNRLERSLSQSPSVAAAQRTDRVHPPGDRQQQVFSVAARETSTARVAANRRRSTAQPAPQTQYRRPTPQTAAPTKTEPTHRPVPVPHRSSPPTSQPPPPDHSPGPDATAASSTAGPPTENTPAIETAPTGTAAQGPPSTETTPAEGTPPVDLQLFTITEVEATSLLAGSGPSGKESIPGSSSPSNKTSDLTNDPKPNDSLDSNVLIPPLGIFVEPSPADVATNGRGKLNTTADSTDQQSETSVENASSTNALSVTVDNFPPGQVGTATETPIPQQILSLPSSTETSNRKVPADSTKQLPAATGPTNEDVSSTDSTSAQATGTPIINFQSVAPTKSAADGNGTTTPDNASTATVGSVGTPDPAGLGNTAKANSRQRGADSSQTGRQTSVRADNSSGRTSRTGQGNPLVALTTSPLASETLSATEVKSPVMGLPSTDASGSPTGSSFASVTHPGAVPREIGPAQTINGPQGSQTAELVDRVATAVHSAQQSQRELRIRLTPPELGTVRIEVSSRGGTLTARLEVETAAAQQTIQHNLSLLHDSLAHLGTTLGRIDVHLAPSRNGEGQPQSGGQQQPGAQQQQQEQQPRQGQQQSHQDLQNPQRSQDEESPGPSTVFHSLDELDIQV